MMLIPSALGQFVDRLLPRRLSVFLHQLYNPYHRWSVGRRSQKLINLVFPSGELKVVGGPFSGTQYLPRSRGSATLPKLLGSYELELHPIIKQIQTKGYTTIIDVGCAEGYYVVGLALTVPTAQIHGFDLDSTALEMCRHLADVNQVSKRVSLHRRCTHNELSNLVDNRTLIICDCEGFEVELLDPNRVPKLRQADILVELHDRIVTDASKTITSRFSSPQRITMISTRKRNPKEYPQLAALAESDQAFALDEFRGGSMEWAFIEGVDVK